MYTTNTMFSVCIKTHRFLKNFKIFKNKVQIITENKTYSTVQYVQGQSPEKKIREYFYYIDHQGMVSRKICVYRLTGICKKMLNTKYLFLYKIVML